MSGVVIRSTIEQCERLDLLLALYYAVDRLDRFELDGELRRFAARRDGVAQSREVEDLCTRPWEGFR